MSSILLHANADTISRADFNFRLRPVSMGLKMVAFTSTPSSLTGLPLAHLKLDSTLFMVYVRAYEQNWYTVLSGPSCGGHGPHGPPPGSYAYEEEMFSELRPLLRSTPEFLLQSREIAIRLTTSVFHPRWHYLLVGVAYTLIRDGTALLITTSKYTNTVSVAVLDLIPYLAMAILMIFYPVFLSGFIADICCGRFKIIRISVALICTVKCSLYYTHSPDNDWHQSQPG